MVEQVNKLKYNIHRFSRLINHYCFQIMHVTFAKKRAKCGPALVFGNCTALLAQVFLPQWIKTLRANLGFVPASCFIASTNEFTAVVKQLGFKRTVTSDPRGATITC